MSGYSGTPLAKKLGIKSGFRVLLVDVPPAVRREIVDALAECRIVKKRNAPLDFVFLFAKSRRELDESLESAAKALASAGMLWIAWPKKGSGVATDLSEDVVRESGLAAGLVDVKVCAVTEVWSGLKFVIPLAWRGERAT